MSLRLDYLAIPRKRSLRPAVIDSLAVVAGLLVVNTATLLLTLRASEIDRGAYLILFGPANAAVAVVALVCTPIAKRWSPDLTARTHIAISLLFPIAAIVGWAALFMSRDGA